MIFFAVFYMIIVVDKGQIVEAGTPEQLLDKNGRFAKLWNLQKG